ncbi:MAG: OmpH family outer membrane protein, partial [bacterium]
ERREQLQVEYRRDRVNLRRMAGDNNTEFSIKRKQALVNLTRMILDTVQAIGKENDYTIIFRNEANFVLYTANQVDITREVITRLDAQASKR